MAFSDSIGLLFQIKADSSDATSELKKLSRLIDAETKDAAAKGSSNLGGLGTSITSLADPAKLAVSAIASIGAAAVGAGAVIFSLAKNFSDYGSSIKDASDKTGLHAETLSSLKYAGDQADTSLEQISKSVKNFTLLVTDAARGNETASASLKRLGISSPQKALEDLDGSLAQVIKRIYEAKPGFEQNALAADAFGKKLGSDLLPFIKQFDGDLPGLIAKAKELGVTLTDEAAASADDFGDQLSELQTITRSVANTFTAEFTPDITKAMSVIGELLVENKGVFKEWGQYIGDIIRGVATPEVNLPKPPKQSSWFDKPDWFPSDEKIVNWMLDNSSTGGTARTLSGENAAKRGKALRESEEKAWANVARAESKEWSPFKTSKDSSAFSGGKAKKEKKDPFAEIEAIGNQLGFKATSKQRDGGPNGRTDHFKKGAVDFGVNTNSKKTIDDWTRLIIAGLTNNKQVLDERIVGAHPGIKGSKNVHLGNSSNKSLFLPQSNYSVPLKYLQELDAKRGSRKGLDVDTGEISRKFAEDKKKDDDKTEKNLQAKRDKNIKAIEDENKHVAELDKAQSDTRLKELDSLLSQKLIKEEDYVREVGLIRLKQLEDEKAANAELLTNPELSGEKRIEIQQAQKLLDANIAQQTIENADRMRDAVKKVNDEYKQQLEELRQIRAETRAQQRDNIDFGKEQERKVLEKDVDSSFGRDKLDARVVLSEFDLEEADRKAARATADAMEDHILALGKIEDIETEKEKVKEINDLYYARIDAINAERGAIRLKTQEEIDTERTKEQSRSGTAGGIAGILAGVVGGGVDPENKIKTQAEYMKAVYADLAGSSKAAIGSMVSGLGQLAATWLSTGKFSAKAALQMVSGIAAGLAIEAGLKALMEYATGLAMAANPFTAALASGHFLAATAYAHTAAVAGVFAVGTGLASRAFGGGGGAASSSFKQQTAPGAATGAAGKSGGGAYSGFGDDTKVIEQGINSPGGTLKPVQVIRHEIKVGNKQYIINTIKENADNNGDLRTLFRNLAAD